MAQKPDQKIEGRYANYFKVGHNAYEFIIDFGQYDAENEEAELYTRIIANPTYTKELLSLLSDSMNRYEEAYGDVEIGNE